MHNFCFMFEVGQSKKCTTFVSCFKWAWIRNPYRHTSSGRVQVDHSFLPPFYLFFPSISRGRAINWLVVRRHISLSSDSCRDLSQTIMILSLKFISVSNSSPAFDLCPSSLSSGRDIEGGEGVTAAREGGGDNSGNHEGDVFSWHFSHTNK